MMPLDWMIWCQTHDQIEQDEMGGLFFKQENERDARRADEITSGFARRLWVYRKAVAEGTIKIEPVSLESDELEGSHNLEHSSEFDKLEEYADLGEKFGHIEEVD